MTPITCIVIPADTHRPLVTRELSTADGRAVEQIVGGSFQVVYLERPESSMYVNVNGKLDGLPLNPRATAILWAQLSVPRSRRAGR